MNTADQVKLYKKYKLMEARVWELEEALGKLISEHRLFQVDKDLETYESILKKKIKGELHKGDEEVSVVAMVG